jgi:hypothetical protein
MASLDELKKEIINDLLGSINFWTALPGKIFTEKDFGKLLAEKMLCK